MPWEVIEKVISHSYESRWPINPESILSFSLTCRDLRPRSLCFLVTNAILHTRDKAFDFCNFLEAKPHLKPFVQSVYVHPRDFVPVPLLQVLVLPNLSRIELVDFYVGEYLPSLNQSTLTCSRLLSARIQTLSLYRLLFKTSLQFFQLLSAFPRIVHLVCQDVFIDREDDPIALPVEVAKQRLSKQLHLRTVSFEI